MSAIPGPCRPALRVLEFRPGPAVALLAEAGLELAGMGGAGPWTCVPLFMVICHPETAIGGRARSSGCVTGAEQGGGDAVGVALGGGMAADRGQEGLPVQLVDG